jgi:hypothetical protein
MRLTGSSLVDCSACLFISIGCCSLRFDAACLPVFTHYTRIKVRLATSGVMMARDEDSREDGGFYGENGERGGEDREIRQS